MNDYKIIICHEPGYREFPVIAPSECPIPKGALLEIFPDEPMKFVAIREAEHSDYENIVDHIRMVGTLERVRAFAVPIPITYFDEEEETDEC